MESVFWYLSESTKILTPVIIGLFAAWIAWRQWKTNSHKLKLDLFDRRYSVYRETLILIECLTIEAEREQLRRFRRRTAKAAFLFKPPVKKFLDELDRNAREMIHNKRQLDNAVRDMNQSVVNQESERELRLSEWLEKTSREVFETFRPYLDFRDIR